VELIYETGNFGWELATNLFTHGRKIKGDRRYSNSRKSAKNLQGKKILQLSKGLKNVDLRGLRMLPAPYKIQYENKNK
jgi:hypothetical protein